MIADYTCLRTDRTILGVRKFIRNTEQMGEQFVPVLDTVEMVTGDMSATVPVIYLLSVSADPTDAIETLAERGSKLSPLCLWGRARTICPTSCGLGQRMVRGFCCKTVSLALTQWIKWNKFLRNVREGAKSRIPTVLYGYLPNFLWGCYKCRLKSPMNRQLG